MIEIRDQNRDPDLCPMQMYYHGGGGGGARGGAADDHHNQLPPKIKCLDFIKTNKNNNNNNVN